ncbi:MAG: hypothetical protein ACOYMV_09120 [Verrucomicrobiia bacterium]
MKLPAMKPRERGLALGMLVVAFLIANYLVVWPWAGRVRERAGSLRKLRTEVGYRQEAVEKAPAWKRELEGLTRSRAVSAPQCESQEAWMKHFESLAGKAGVELVDRRSNRREEAKGGNALRVECSLQGGFAPVVRFLAGLQEDPSHPQVEVLQLSPLKAGEDRLRAQLTLNVGLRGASSPPARGGGTR